jgi:hypothetical protein
MSEEVDRVTEQLEAAHPEPRVTERILRAPSGLLMLFAAFVLLLAGIAILVATGGGAKVAGVLAILVALLGFKGLVAVSPGEARVVQLLGRYKGTVRADGLRWINPFAVPRRISTRIRNMETQQVKVNDADGNPIEVAAVVVWQVEDTAKALYEVDSFQAFVSIQAETAVRHVAGNYPYDSHSAGELSLRDNAEEITGKLSAEITARVAPAGVHVIESRITRLSYAPEIAQVMLQRQQASAVVSARTRIVEGAVGMVELALKRLSEQDIVELDEERKAAMVSNLLVVLCGDRGTQPIVNAGSLYQ